MPYIDMSKLQHLLTEVHPQPLMYGECELCGKVGTPLYMVGGTYGCHDCRNSIAARIKNEENLTTGDQQRPQRRDTKVAGGPFTTTGHIMPQPQSPFTNFMQQRMEPALHTYLDSMTLLRPETVKNLTKQMVARENPIRTTAQLTALREEQRRQEEKRWQEEQQKLHDAWELAHTRTPSPASGESSTTPAEGWSASGEGKAMREASPRNFLDYLFSTRLMHDFLNSSGSPTGQPSPQSSMNTDTQTMTSPAESTWPFPEEDSQPVIGQVLPLEPER